MLLLIAAEDFQFDSKTVTIRPDDSTPLTHCFDISIFTITPTSSQEPTVKHFRISLQSAVKRGLILPSDADVQIIGKRQSTLSFNHSGVVIGSSISVLIALIVLFILIATLVFVATKKR